MHEGGYLWEATFTTRNTNMDSNPMQQIMMPLYNTASFLVQANMSIDKGVAILKNHKNIQSHFYSWAYEEAGVKQQYVSFSYSNSTASEVCTEIHTSQRQQRWTWRRRRGCWKSGPLPDRWSPQFLHLCQRYLQENEEDNKMPGAKNTNQYPAPTTTNTVNVLCYLNSQRFQYHGPGLGLPFTLLRSLKWASTSLFVHHFTTCYGNLM